MIEPDLFHKAAGWYDETAKRISSGNKYWEPLNLSAETLRVIRPPSDIPAEQRLIKLDPHDRDQMKQVCLFHLELFFDAVSVAHPNLIQGRTLKSDPSYVQLLAETIRGRPWEEVRKVLLHIGDVARSIEELQKK